MTSATAEATGHLPTGPDGGAAAAGVVDAIGHSIDAGEAVRRLVSLCAEAGGSDPAGACEVARSAAELAWLNHVGRFALPELEAILVSIGSGSGLPRPAPVRRRPPAEAGSRILHVLTEGYPVGGHTRTAWRWIQLDRRRQHTVVLLEQRSPLPEKLAAAACRSGGLVNLTAVVDPIERAMALREMAWRFDAVVVHQHPHDPVPVVAFGAVEGRPPVAVVDHADQSFWLGASIADVLLGFRLVGLRLAHRRRGIAPHRIVHLPLPSEPTERTRTSAEAKAALGLPPDARMILALGADYKFHAAPGEHITDLLHPVLDAVPSAVLVVVGPGGGGRWAQAQLWSGGRVFVVPPQADLAPFLEAADVYLESSPHGGYTATMDAAGGGVVPVSYCPDPSVARWTTTEPIGEAHLRPATPAELATMLVGLLTAPDIATELGERAAAEVVARHGEAELGRRLAAAYERLGAVAPVARPPHVESVEEPLDDLLRSWAVSSRRAIDATASWHRAHASLAARGAATAAAGVGHGVVVAPRPVAPRTTLFAVPTWDEPARLRALLRSFSAAFGADAPVSLVLADASGRPLADQVAVLEPILADVGPTADLVLSSAALEPSDSGQGRCVLLAGALDAAPGGLWACEPYVGALEAEHLQTLAGTASRHAGT